MNSMLRRRYSRYVSRSFGTEGVLKSSNGMQNVTGRIVVRDEILQQEEVHVAPEALEQCEEVAVQLQRLTQAAGVVQPQVVSSNALEREIEAVRDPAEAPAGLVDGPLAVDPVAA